MRAAVMEGQARPVVARELRAADPGAHEVVVRLSASATITSAWEITRRAGTVAHPWPARPRGPASPPRRARFWGG